MRRLVLLSACAVVTFALAACVAPGRGNSVGGRYTDPYTCEIKNRRETDPPYDADCIQSAQRAAINSAKNAQKGQAKK